MGRSVCIPDGEGNDVRQIKALIIGLAFGVVLAAQAFTLAALLNGRVMADSVAMIAWADAQVALILLGSGIIATLILMFAMFRRRRRRVTRPWRGGDTRRRRGPLEAARPDGPKRTRRVVVNSSRKRQSPERA